MWSSQLIAQAMCQREEIHRNMYEQKPNLNGTVPPFFSAKVKSVVELG